LYIFCESIYQGKPITFGAWFFFLLTIYILLWIGYGELRTKAISTTFIDNTVYIRRFYGLGPSTYLDIADFDGYSTSILLSRGGRYEYLYLKRGEKKVIKLSEFYHRNYSDLKEYITKRIAYLGDEEFSFRTELKEIFI